MHRHLAVFALLAAVTGAACSTPPPSGSSSAAARDAGGGPASPSTSPAAAGRAVEITATDAMKYSLTTIAAKPGERLSVTLVNLGTTPKFSMGHNWVLLASGVDVQAFLVAAGEAVTSDYLPAGPHKPSILAATKLLGPKERDTVTFTAPDAPGRYEFVCSFPGHFQVGMRGVLVVE